MYCGTCIHDNTLAAALMDEGHDVVLMPAYTPIRTDEEDVSSKQVFYGAVNVYLQQKVPFFRHAPGVLRWLLDRPALLRMVSRFSDTSDASSYGDLTLSVLQGDEGNQASELERMLDWLETFDPEIVHLNQVMFAGFVRAIHRRLGVPVVCSLTGEDLFLDNLAEPHRTAVREELRRRAGEIEAFFAPSRFYADAMAPYLGVERSKVRVVPLGLNLEAVQSPSAARPSDPGSGFTVGYLARICPEKGLHVLVDAFRRLTEAHPDRPDLRLEVGGYVARQFEPYLEEQRRKVEAWGLADRVTLHGELDREAKLRLLGGIDAFSVPATYPEPKGLYVLEALANGVPVVEPRRGSFPELLEATGGGLLVEGTSDDETAAAVAEGLGRLLRDPALRADLGRKGREAVESRFDKAGMARATAAVYRDVLAR